mgnify:CR=1 FL=1
MLPWNEQTTSWWFRLEQEYADLSDQAGMKYVLSHLDTLEPEELHDPQELSLSSSFAFAC